MSKFTPSTRGALIERFAAGCTIRDAAKASEISEKTLKTWLAQGRRDTEGPFAEFVEAVEAARQEAHDRPEPMDADELARVVSHSARKGNTSAMKLRWEMILADRRPTEEEAEDPLADIDELAARRAV